MAETMPADLTAQDVARELAESLPEWRRHMRCPEGMRCRREHGEWMDALLDEMLSVSPATTPATIAGA